MCSGIAQMILHTRVMRRKVLLQLVGVLHVLVVLGAWRLAGWLSGNMWLCLLWWGASLFYGLLDRKCTRLDSSHSSESRLLSSA